MTLTRQMTLDGIPAQTVPRARTRRTPTNETEQLTLDATVAEPRTRVRRKASTDRLRAKQLTLDAAMSPKVLPGCGNPFRALPSEVLDIIRGMKLDMELHMKEQQRKAAEAAELEKCRQRPADARLRALQWKQWKRWKTGAIGAMSNSTPHFLLR